MEQIITDYQSGIGLTTLMRRYKMGYPRVRRILVENEIEIRKPTWHGMAERDRRIRTMYENGLGMNAISKRFEIHRLTVGLALQRQGSKSRNQHPKHIINPTELINFKRELGSYWFGFMCGDGCINTDHSFRLICKLQYNDIGHLYNWSKDLRTTKIPKKIERKKTTLPGARSASLKPACSLTIYNKDLCQAYLANGWRSFKDGFENGNEVRTIDVRHFLRGFMDADGLVYEQNLWQGGYKRKTKRIKKLVVGYCSPHPMVLEWIRYLMFMSLDLRSYNKTGYNTIIRKKKTKMYEVLWTGENAVKIARWLYLSQSRHLSRKFEKVRPYVFS